MRYRAEKKRLHIIFLLGPPRWWDGPEEESTQSRRKEDEKLFTEELVMQYVCVSVRVHILHIFVFKMFFSAITCPIDAKL